MSHKPSPAPSTARGQLLSRFRTKVSIHGLRATHTRLSESTGGTGFEPFQTELTINEVRPGDLAVDIGAHIGYYKAARIEGEPRYMYLGFGPAGKQHEILDRVEKRRKLAARTERKALAAEMADDSRSWRQHLGWLRTVTTSTLLLSGWYRHHGQWRSVMGRPRTRQENVPSLRRGDAIALQSRLNSLNERANAGEPGAVDELRVFLEEHPEIWETMGDLSKASVTMWITRLMGADSLSREAMTIGLEEWKEEFLGPDPSPIERAAGDAMVSAKLALAYAGAVAW